VVPGGGLTYDAETGAQGLRLRTRGWFALPLGLLLAACGDLDASSGPATPSTSPASASSSSAAAPELIGTGLVLQEPGRSSVLCLGAVAASAPPQCSGLPIDGWDWREVVGEERSGGATWGEYVVAGTYDGERFTTTRPGELATTYDGPLPTPPEEPALATLCPQRDDERRVVDGSRTSEAALRRTQRVAGQLEGFADTWLDESTTQDEGKPSEPSQAVLNVRVTGDTDAAAVKLRETWGGRLCVSKALRSKADLRKVEESLDDLPEIEHMSSGFDQVSLLVVHDDGSLQRSLDEKYGVGVVVVTSQLQPYPKG
jgi:hypothetical protein